MVIGVLLSPLRGGREALRVRPNRERGAAWRWCPASCSCPRNREGHNIYVSTYTLAATFLPTRCGVSRHRIRCVNVTVYCKLCASVEQKCPALLEGNSSSRIPGERRAWYAFALHGGRDAYQGASHLRERLPSRSVANGNHTRSRSTLSVLGRARMLPAHVVSSCLAVFLNPPRMSNQYEGSMVGRLVS